MERLLRDATTYYEEAVAARKSCASDAACQSNLIDYRDEEFAAAIRYIELTLIVRHDLDKARAVVSESISEGPSGACIRESLANPNITKLLVRYLTALKEANTAVSEDLFNELSKGKPDLDAVEKLLRAHPADAALVRGRLQSAGSVSEQVDWARRQTSRTMLVVETAPTTGACSEGEAFLNQFERRATEPGVIRRPLRVHPSDFEDVLRQAPCLCGGQAACVPPSKPLPTHVVGQMRGTCSAVVGIGVDYRGSDLVASGSIHFMLPRGLRLRQSQWTTFLSRPFRSQCGNPTGAMQDQMAAAEAFFDDMLTRYEILHQGSVLEQDVPGALIVPPLTPGTTIHELQRRRVQLEKLQGLTVSGECRPDFARAVRRQMASYGFSALPPAAQSANAPALDLKSSERGGCLATLSAGAETALRLEARVSKEDQWEAAGEIVAARVGAYYLTTSMPPPPPPSRWNALLLSGLPFLQDPAADARVGWVFAGTDLAFLATGIGSLAFSIDARNRATDNGGASMDSANAFLNVGIGLLAVVVVERFVSALVYSPPYGGAP